jgi:uncharacterized DUF497 family protein
LVFDDLDWHHGAAHMLEKHQVTVAEATEALRDPERVVIDPDYNSESGRAARIIGFSQTAGTVLTIIALEHEGVEYGVNGWRSNAKDRRIYREGEYQ